MEVKFRATLSSGICPYSDTERSQLNVVEIGETTLQLSEGRVAFILTVNCASFSGFKFLGMTVVSSSLNTRSPYVHFG